jgi:hypothetical protein
MFAFAMLYALIRRMLCAMRWSTARRGCDLSMWIQTVACEHVRCESPVAASAFASLLLVTSDKARRVRDVMANTAV